MTSLTLRTLFPACLAGWTLVSIAGASVLVKAAPAAGSASAPTRPPSSVELQYEKLLNGAEQVTLRNRTRRALTVELRGMAYAGQGNWEHWWTQHAIPLAPSGSWTAAIHEVRYEKLEVWDRSGRRLADLDVRKNPPTEPWKPVVALHARGEWQPFRKAELFGHHVSSWFYPGMTRHWRTVSPAELPAVPAEFDALRLRVIGDAPVTALTGAQIERLREGVRRGRTLLVVGGTDQSRLRGWERAGLLATPVRGARSLPGLRSLARRYGLPEFAAPVPALEVGPVTAPARVLLEEDGVPLVVERPVGLGTLLLVTFDPTRAPFRGSALEKAFWQEWAGRGELDLLRVHYHPTEAAAYRRLERQLRMQPPATGTLAGVWLGYLALLALVLATTRRRLLGVVALSAGASVAILAVGPVLRSGRPVAAQAGVIYLRSGARRGLWRGVGQVMLPGTRTVKLRAAQGSTDLWDAPRVRLPGEQEISEQPLLKRWVPQPVGQLEAPVAVTGPVGFELELNGEDLMAAVRNETAHPLQDATVVWGRTAVLQLGDLPPWGRVERRLARVAPDGTLRGASDTTPAVFGRTTGWGDTPDTYHAPLLLARAPALPAAALLIDGQPVAGRDHTTLMIGASGWQARGAFRLPPGTVAARVVHARGWTDRWFGPRRAGWLILDPGGSVVLELQLPHGAGRGSWTRMALGIERDTAMPLRVQVFDWSRRQWLRAAALAGAPVLQPQPRRPSPWPPSSPSTTETRTIPLASPGHLINPRTDVLLVRIENSGTDASGGVAVELSGHGHAR